MKTETQIADEIGINTFSYFWETVGKTIVFQVGIVLVLGLIVIGGYFLMFR